MAEEEMMQEFLRVIQEESDHLLDLINDLLDVGQIESGKLNMNFELHHPPDVLQEILPIPSLQSPVHQIVPEIRGEIPQMLLDKPKWKKVLVNLVSNAIKYSPKGGEIRILMEKKEDFLQIDVSDPGIGIQEEYLQKIFGSFYRVDSSMTTEIPGTGLGLVIVKAIVEQHGGQISVKSEVGQGTTFTIRFPILRNPMEIPVDENTGS